MHFRFRVFLLAWSLIFLMLFIHIVASADFHPTDHPTLGISSSGFGNYQSHAIEGELPLKFIDGYVGIRYYHSRNDGKLLGDELLTRLEGGHTFSWLSLRGYLRYGRGIASLYEDNAFHGGGYAEASVYRKKDWSIGVGIGTWAEKSVLAEYGETIDPDPTGLAIGPRGHLSVKHKAWQVNSVLYLHPDIRWSAKVLPSWRLKLPFGFQFVLSGEIAYFPEKKDRLRLRWMSGFHRAL